MYLFGAFLLICVVLAIVLPLVLIDNFSANRTSSLNHPTAIGNYLSDYFYINYATEDNYIFPETISGEIKNFLENIAKNDNKPTVLLPLFRGTNPSDKWAQLGRANFLNFWKQARPRIRDLYNKVIPNDKKNVKLPVVHFRCSDVPFNRHNMYHIPTVKTIKEIINILLQKGVKEVIWLNCNKHSGLLNKCDEINNLYIDLFEKNGIKVTKRCNSILEDFYLMIYCPILVSLNSSSFSFMAGISKDPTDYISCSMGIEKNGVYEHQNDADWILVRNDPLLHKDVKNYYDIEEVKVKLFNKF